MFCAVVSAAVDTVDAAKYKVIDNGTKYLDNDVKGDKNIKSVWKTKSNGKKVVVYSKGYNKFGKKNYQLVSNRKMIITKVSKTKVKVTTTSYRTKYWPNSKKTYYERTNLSPRAYYSEYKLDFRGL